MKKIRITLDLTPDMKHLLEELAENDGISQGEVLRHAVIIFKAIKDAEKEGQRPALVKDGKIVVRLVGF